MKQAQKFFLFIVAIILFAANTNAGRWITCDPMEVQEHMQRDSHALLELNPYTFVRNNPLSYVDSWGLNSQIVIGPNGQSIWVGPHNQTPPGMQFGLWSGNEEFKPPGWIWGQDQYGNSVPIANDLMGLQPSLLGELLLPSGAGLLAKPSWLTGMKVPARTTCLYRAVSKEELEDMATHGFRPGRNSLLGKSFAMTAEDAAKFGRDLFKLDQRPFFVIEANVDRSILNYATQMTLDWKPAIVVPFERLQSFNWAVNRVTTLPSIPIR